MSDRRMSEKTRTLQCWVPVKFNFSSLKCRITYLQRVLQAELHRLESLWASTKAGPKSSPSAGVRTAREQQVETRSEHFALPFEKA